MSRSRRGAVALAALALLAGCGKREPPSGGPPDLTSPRLVRSVPDSGASHVALDVRPVLTFSEGMEPRSTGEAVSIAPPVEIRQRRWSRRAMTLVLAEPLQANRTYTLIVAGTARDRHGNTYDTGATVVFSTADSFPPGVVGGKLEARGFSAPGSYIWCYREGRAPDSTARDFDALGIVDEDDAFRVSGLGVPGRYRLWVFADLNGNRSFEPSSDILAPVDTIFAIDAEQPRVENLLLRVVNPRAPGSVSGTVIDSLPDSTGTLYVSARSESDTTKREQVEVDREGVFELRLDAGTWTVRAFRDLDSNRSWQPAKERSSAPLRVVVEPAGRIAEVKLVVRPETGGP